MIAVEMLLLSQFADHNNENDNFCLDVLLTWSLIILGEMKNKHS